MAHEPPAIVKLAERVLGDVERAVREFPRFHKYATGARLRDQAWAAAELAHRAWRERDARTELLVELGRAIDALKLGLQLAKQVEAFKSFRQFEAIARLANDLGRQCGGWQKQHLRGQNRKPATSATGRAETLSARDASRAGANP